MSLRYVCNSCLRAARQSRSTIAQATQTRTAASSSNSKETTTSSQSNDRLQTIAGQVDQQSHLANESTNAPSSLHDSPDLTISQRAALRFRSQFQGTTETYVAYGATQQLYAQCSAQANYTIPQAPPSTADDASETPATPKNVHGEDIGVALPHPITQALPWWYATLGLTPTFSTWAQINFLHMYLVSARMRRFPREHVGAWNQHLTDHFFHDAEARMDALHGITASSIRNRYLKDLFVQYRGVTMAYDEGLVRGDAALAGAVWRNVYKAAGAGAQAKGEVARDVAEVDWVGVAQVVSYMRRTLARLDAMSDAEVTSGEELFDSPAEDRTGVLMGHAGLDQPFVDTP